MSTNQPEIVAEQPQMTKYTQRKFDEAACFAQLALVGERNEVFYMHIRAWLAWGEFCDALERAA